MCTPPQGFAVDSPWKGIRFQVDYGHFVSYCILIQYVKLVAKNVNRTLMKEAIFLSVPDTISAVIFCHVNSFVCCSKQVVNLFHLAIADSNTNADRAIPESASGHNF